MIGVIRRKVNDKAWFNEDYVNAFYYKQSDYRLWLQNKSNFLWQEYVVHRRHVQSFYDAALLEYNNCIRDSLSTAMQPHSGGLLLKHFFLARIPVYLVLLHMTNLKWQSVFCRFSEYTEWVIRNSIFLQLVFQIQNSLFCF